MIRRTVTQTLLLVVVLLSPASAQEGRIVGAALSSGFSMGLPLGMPPGPTNQRMLAAAPQDVAFFLTWSPVAEPDAESDNRAEQLIANPEVQYLLDYVAQSLERLVDHSTADDKTTEAIAQVGQDLATTLLVHETALYVRTEDNLSGGLVCDLGDQAAEIQNTVGTIAKMGGDQVATSTKDGLTIYSVAIDPSLRVELTVGNRYLILGIGDGELAAILERFKANQIAPWLQTAIERCEVDRPSNLTYINIDHLSKSLESGRDLPAELSAMGLSDIQTMTCVTGLDQDAVVIRTVFQIKEPLRKRLRAIGKTLKADDLDAVPPDSTIMAAAKIDATSVTDAIFAVLEATEEGLSEDVEREFTRQFGIELRRDFLDALGDTVQLYVSPREGGTLLSGWTAVIDVDDPAKIQRIGAKLETMFNRPDSSINLIQRQLGDDTVSYLTFKKRPPIVTPAWCVSGNRLIVSSFPQSIYALLNRTPTPADQKIVATLQEQDASVFIRIREQDVAELAYPLIAFLVTQMPADIPDDIGRWIELDPGALPSLPAITNHLGDATITCGLTDGLEIVRHQTLPPSGGALLAVIGLMGEQFADAIESAYGGKKSVQSNINMEATGQSQTSSPLIADVMMTEAKKLADAGRHQEACVRYRELIIRDDSNAEAYFGLGNSLYETKRYKLAEEAFSKGLSITPQNPQGHFGLGKAIWIQDRNEESIAEFKKAIELAPDFADAWQFLGLAHHSLRQYDDAVAALSRTIQLDATKWFAFYTRAGIHFNAQRYNQALADYSRVLQLRPSESDAHYYRGLAYQSAGQLDKAIDDLSNRIAAKPLDKKAISARASAYSDAKKFRFAIRDYSALIGINSDNAQAWQSRAGCRMSLSQYDAAISDYTQAIQRRPNKYAFANRAICWENKKEFAKAVDDYNQAIKIDPEYVYALDSRSYAYMQLKQYAKSKSSYERTVEVAGESDSLTLSNFSWLLAACPDDAVRDGKLAVKYATKACEITDWKQAWIIDNVAAAHAETGDFEKAIHFAQMAIKTSDSQAIRDDIQSRLDLYKQNQPARMK